MSAVTQSVKVGRLLWEDLKRHDYSDEDIARTVAEMFKPKSPESRRIPHKRFYDGIQLYATFTIQRPTATGSFFHITYEWDEPSQASQAVDTGGSNE